MFRILSFCFAGVTLLSALFLEKSPCFRSRPLTAKMLSSLGFLLTGICAAISVGFTSYSIFMLSGLLLGSLGDFFLDYKERKYMLWGALFFGGGHILYIMNFITSFGTDMFTAPYTTQIIGLVIFMAIMSVIVLLLNKIRFSGKYRPMAVYALVLLASFIISFTRGMVEFTSGNTPIAYCLLGASALFIASDTSLAISMFGTPPHKFFERMTKALVNPTYFPAQALFALSILFFN